MKCQYCNSEFDPANGPCSCTYQSEPNYSNFQQGYRPPTAVELIKQVGNSTMYLVASILYTVFVGLQFLSSQQFDVIGILTVIGLWMFYSECKKPSANPYTMKTSSLTVLKAAQTVTCVILWIGIVAIALCMLVFLIFVLPAINEIESGWILFTVLLIIMAVVLAMLICQLIIRKGIKRFITSISESAKTGLRPDNLSSFTPKFWMVMICINAAFIVIAYILFIIFCSALIVFLMSILPSTYINQSDIGTSTFELSLSLLKNTSKANLVVSFLPSIIFSLLPFVPSFMFAKIMLDSKNLADNAYYPNEEELFYQRQAFFEQYNQAYGYTQNGYQAQYTQSPEAEKRNPCFTQIPYYQDSANETQNDHPDNKDINDQSL